LRDISDASDYDVVHGDRLGAAVLHADLQMVLQIGADAGHVGDHLNAEIAQDLRWPETAELQQLRRIECAAGDDHFAIGVSRVHHAMLQIGDADGAAS
jgi:hypothetical protein